MRSRVKCGELSKKFKNGLKIYPTKLPNFSKSEFSTITAHEMHFKHIYQGLFQDFTQEGKTHCGKF